MRMRITALLALLLAAAAVRADEGEEVPTPEERVAALKAERADARVDLGAWAKGKKLLSEAKLQFLLAVALDPDCRRARQRLGQRKSGSGEWEERSGRDWLDAEGAREKYGDEFAAKEAELIDEEATAFEHVGLALAGEGREDLGRPLLLHAWVLAPKREGAATALGLVRIGESWGTPEERAAWDRVPKPVKTDLRGYISTVLEISTVVRQCGAVIAETIGNEPAADRLASAAQRAHVLTAGRIGTTDRGPGWMWLGVTAGRAQFEALVDRIPMVDRRRETSKKVGNCRMFQPRHFSGAWAAEAGDPSARAPLFVHMAAEDTVYTTYGGKAPQWLVEVVGVDAVRTVLGVPGPLCVTWERSTGLGMKERLADLAGWSRLLNRRAGAGLLPKFEPRVYSQLQALGPEDVVAAHAYYRLLLLERPEAFAPWLKAAPDAPDPIRCFEEHFGIHPEKLTERLTKLLTGG
jgi:hypothetical protein